jgi:hypothetical protein
VRGACDVFSQLRRRAAWLEKAAEASPETVLIRDEVGRAIDRGRQSGVDAPKRGDDSGVTPAAEIEEQKRRLRRTRLLVLPLTVVGFGLWSYF